MQITIKLFAFLQDQLGPTVTVELDSPLTVGKVFAAVAKQNPAVKAVLENSRLAVNQEFVSGNDLEITPTDEVAIIPPVSGG
jgi:molybdopterin synthase sulfur carrier subunit